MIQSLSKRLRLFVEDNHKELAELVQEAGFDAKWRISTPGFLLSEESAQEFGNTVFEYLAKDQGIIAPFIYKIDVNKSLSETDSLVTDDHIHVGNTNEHQVKYAIARGYSHQFIDENASRLDNLNLVHGLNLTLTNDILENVAPKSSFMTGYLLGDELRRAHRSVVRTLHFLDKPVYQNISENREKSIATAAVQLLDKRSSYDLKDIVKDADSMF